MSAQPPRIVLDSNVCLDLFAFRAPDLAPLLEALRSGAIEAVTDAECRAEWQRVLTYPQLKLDPAARERSLLDYDRWLRVFGHDADAQTVALPRCADP
ncbi:MAG: PIN domain-containing protein, partial [Lysobacter sp.]|nr:PIN domain-containing protein [Lysobacter sp.]